MRARVNHKEQNENYTDCGELKISDDKPTARFENDKRNYIEKQQETSKESRVAYEVELNEDNQDETEP